MCDLIYDFMFPGYGQILTCLNVVNLYPPNFTGN